MPSHGPGSYADLAAPVQHWGGRKAQQYTRLCLAEYGTICWLCGLPGATSADHIVPRSKGGAVYDIRNLGPSHPKCNSARRDRPADGPVVPIDNGMAFFSA